MLRGVTSVWLAGLLVATGSACVAASPDLVERYEFAQAHMGTSFKIALYAPDEASANAAAAAAFDRIEQLNTTFSDYDPQSEAMRLCRDSGPGKPVRVSPELLYVLTYAQGVAERTDGAFDVTVGPIVKLWRRARRQHKLPEDDLLEQAKQQVGYRQVRIDAAAQTVELLQPKMRLDFGGIAKGYAGDEALRVLREHGIRRALIAASGDIVAGDPPPGEEAWRVGIAPVEDAEAAPTRFLRLVNAAVSTSGDAFQFVEIDGIRYSHVIDPRSGKALTTRSSVTVVAQYGITSDALDSAATVLGFEQGLEFLERSKPAEGLIVQLIEGDERSVATSGFARFVDR